MIFLVGFVAISTGIISYSIYSLIQELRYQRSVINSSPISSRQKEEEEVEDEDIPVDLDETEDPELHEIYSKINVFNLKAMSSCQFGNN